MDVFKRLQQVASACTWLMLALAFGGVLGVGSQIGDSLSVNEPKLLAGLGVAALGAAIVTAISLTELDNPALTRTGPVADLGRLVYLGGVTGALVVAHGVESPLWVLYVPVLLSIAFVDRPWKSLSYAFAASILTFTATAVSHDVEKASALDLLLVLPALPAVVWFTSTLANSIAHLHGDAAAERARQREEVEQLRADLIETARVEREALLDETRRERAELKVKVDRLSESLANAARGDLSNANTAWSNAVDDADQTMASLLEDEHLRSRGVFLDAVDDAGEFTVTATPFRLDDHVTPSPGTRVPGLGADNDTLLADPQRD